MRFNIKRLGEFPLNLGDTSNGGGGSFSPLDLPNLVLWLDSSDASTLWQQSDGTVPADSNGDVVGRWDDKSANGYHVTQSTTSLKPLKQANGIQFDGADDYLSNTSFQNFGDNYTAFAVARYNIGADVTNAIFEVSNGTTNKGFLLLHESLAAWRGGSIGGHKTISGSDLRDSNFYLHTGINKGAELEYWINAVSQGTLAIGTNIDTLNALHIGILASASIFGLNGYIKEIIICDATLSADNIANTESYMNNKWGVY
jgi:hypothetical protein